MRIVAWATSESNVICKATVQEASLMVVCDLFPAPLPPPFFFWMGEGRAPKGALPQSAATPPPVFFLGGGRSTKQNSPRLASLRESVSSWDCASFTLSIETQQVWLDNVGEEIECSSRRSTIRNILQAFSGEINSKRGINSRIGIASIVPRKIKRHATGRVKTLVATVKCRELGETLPRSFSNGWIVWSL